MNNQVKLIDADKLIQTLKISEERNHSAGFRDVKFSVRNIELLIETGTCNPDASSVPTIKPGDKVKHPRYPGEGEVLKQGCGDVVYCRFGPSPSGRYYEVDCSADDLEVVE